MDVLQMSPAEDYVTNACILICMTDLELNLTANSIPWTKVFSDDGFCPVSENKSVISEACRKIFAGEFQQEVNFQKVFHFETTKSLTLSIYPYFQGAGISGFFITAKADEINISALESAPILDKKFRDTFQNSVVGMATVSLSGKWIDVNERICTMVGYTREEMRKISFQEITHPDDLHNDLRLLDKLRQGKIESYEIEKRYYHQKGHLVWVNLAVTLVRDSQGEPSYFVSQIEDISITKKAMETILENENIFKGIFHSSYQFTALLTKDGRVREINNAALGFFGLTVKESVGKPFHELPNWNNSEENIARLIQNIKRAASGEYINSEEKLWDNEKNEVQIDFTLKPVFDEKEEVVSVVAEGKLIQEIIDARIKLFESEQKLRLFFNLSPVAFVVNDLETGNFIDFNDSFLENTGYTREEMLQLNYLQLFPEELHWMEPVVIRKLKETGVLGPVEIDYSRRDGVRFPIMINGVLTRDRSGREQIWSVVQDIKELKQKEFELQELNQEIAAQNQLLSISNDELQQFAYVASHDLQEPLRMVTGFLTLLSARYQDALDEKAQEYIHFAVDGATRMRQIIVDMLEYSKIDHDNTPPQLTDINQVIKHVVQLFAVVIGEKNATITCENLPVIDVRTGPIQQLFSNILSNALKYHSPGVAPKVTVRAEELPHHWQFCIADNGIGISSEHHEKIFALFSRLNGKREYEGTGIGLALCRKIVERHGGKIWVESSLNEGSKFYFTLLK